MQEAHLVRRANRRRHSAPSAYCHDGVVLGLLLMVLQDNSALVFHISRVARSVAAWYSLGTYSAISVISSPSFTVLVLS